MAEPHHSNAPRPERPRHWRRGTLPILGLIGGIGAGKSTVAALMAAKGAFIVDADAVGHALLEQTPAREAVASRFGDAVLAPPGPDGIRPIDRAALGALVFNDPAALRDLEAILHPAMRRTFERAIARNARLRRASALVLDAAILLEAGWDDLCDLVVYVDAMPDRRLERLKAGRGWSAEVLEARERAQWTAEKKRKRADALIANDSSPEELARRVDAFWAEQIARPAPPGRPGAGRASPVRGQPPPPPRSRS